MKKCGIILFFLLAVTAMVKAQTSAAYKQNGRFTLNGRITGGKSPGKMYLYFLDKKGGAHTAVDSCLLKNGLFVFKGMLDEPVLAKLRFAIADVSIPENERSDPKYDELLLYMEPAIMNLATKYSLKYATVTGSRSENDYITIQKDIEKYNSAIGYINYLGINAANKNDSATVSRMLLSKDSVMDEIYLYYQEFASSHAQSPVALYTLSQCLKGASNKAGALEKTENIYNALAVSVKSTASGQELEEAIRKQEATGIGRIAPDFTQADTLGNAVTLSSFRGKYVLLDFWASWCGPCRAENPNVVKAFNQYKDKGFTILSVSLDQPGGKSKWLKAIHDDGLNWTHVSDLQFWSNAVAKLYYIQSVPSNLLLDKDGKIIAKNLRGPALDKKLGELFQ